MPTEQNSRPSPANVAATLLMWALAVAAFAVAIIVFATLSAARGP